MRCCKNLRSLIVFSALLLCAASFAQAAGIGLRNAHLTPNEDGFALAADFTIDFNARLEEAINKGVVLYFTAEFELGRSRWYWFDQQLIRRSRTFQLSYHALTRQYRLSTGALHQGYATLGEALRIVSRLRNWQVIEKGETTSGDTYLAALRLRLDLSQMPKTFQVSAFANRDWNLSSAWLRWAFAPASEAAPPSAGEAQAPAPLPVSPALPLAAPPPAGLALPPAVAPTNGEAK